MVKAERNADGDLEVFGKAAGPELDIAYQICDPKWLKAAMPEWMRWGNVREQHSMLAAGVGTELTEDGTGWQLKSVCVDPGTAVKLEKGVLKGYSVGIKNPKVVKDAGAPNGRIVGGTIVEVSYVDRPANPTCTLTIAKAADGGTELQPVDAPDTDEQTAAKAVLADLAALLPDVDLTKAADTESTDIAGAMDAVATIARLIQSEAAGLAAGQMNEAMDIRLLLDAVSALRWFMEREAAEPEPSEEDDNMDSLISLGVHADLVKAATADTATDDDRAALRADTLKALGLDGLADSIAEKVTTKMTADIESTKAAEAKERTALADRLAEVERMAAPGGPVRARTSEQTNKAAQADQKRAQAAHYRRIAGQVDHVTAEGYLAKAALLDAEIAATA
ncbi:MAG: hypothetical protein M3N98_16135 [Actinomycetota bacterium]|nr:hypothetical protein [Actinomycetota bacterium]